MMINKILLVLLIFGVGTAYAQPLQYVETQVLDYDGESAIIKLDWMYNENASKYEIGCVTCIPNVTFSTTDTSFTIHGVTAIQNGDAVLYVMSYGSDGEIINVLQVIVNIKG